MNIRIEKRKWGFLKGLSAVLFSLALALGMIPIPGIAFIAKAAGDKSIVGLGTGPITDPVNAAGGWCYVYYGSSNPAKYRVLDKDSTHFGVTGGSLLLDCMQSYGYHRFDDDSNVWSSSELKEYINGIDFLNANYTVSEQNAIARSYKASPVSGFDGSCIDSEPNYDFSALTGEKLFVLDFYELTNTNYGFVDQWLYNSNNTGDLRKKPGLSWWARSRNVGLTAYATLVATTGAFGGYSVDYNYDVSPAFNINLASVIFTSEISSANKEYKLTVYDSGMVTTPVAVSRNGDDVTVQYTLTGTDAGNADRISVLITDSAYSAGAAKASGYTYLKLSGDVSGSGSFTIPAAYSNGVWGTDYYVYLLAEDVYTGNATDYASAPAQIPESLTPGSGVVPKPVPIITDGTGQDLSGEEVDDTPEPNYIDALMKMLEEAKEAGGAQTVYWSEGTALPGPVMKFLSENPQITLIFSYTYQGLDYTVTLLGKNVKYDSNIPWCGPLYLYDLYGRYSASAPVKATNSTLTLGNRTYTITSGDSLWDIARRLGISVDELVGMNNIADADRINIGQIIRY